VLNISY